MKIGELFKRIKGWPTAIAPFVEIHFTKERMGTTLADQVLTGQVLQIYMGTGAGISTMDIRRTDGGKLRQSFVSEWDCIEVVDQPLPEFSPYDSTRTSWQTWCCQHAARRTPFKIKGTDRHGMEVLVVGCTLNEGAPMLAPVSIIDRPPTFTSGSTTATHHWLMDVPIAFGGWVVAARQHPGEYLERNEALAKARDTRFPHWCQCGAPAYEGAYAFECHATCSRPARDHRRA